MTTPRRYSVAEVQWIVDLFRENGDEVSSEQIAGMDKLVEVLRHYEHMSETDIEAEVKANWNRA